MSFRKHWYHTFITITYPFRVRKAIPVCSAREGTQIVRPCEYDYILILEALSQPGAVSLTFYKYNRQLMFVTLEDNDTRSLFYDCIGRKDHMKAAGEFPKRGLREFFVNLLPERSYCVQNDRSRRARVL